jgi:Arc/MetJ family transcription regulator
MIDLDDEALEKARRYYGTATKRDTVNSALRDAAARQDAKRRALGAFLAESVSEYEGLDDAGKAEFRARMVAPERSFQEQIDEYERRQGPTGGRGR